MTPILQAGRYFVLIPDGPPCEKCGQPQGVELNVSGGGYGVHTGYQHRAECPTLRCAHGVLHSDDCADCEAIKLAEGTDETCGACCSGVHEQCEGSGCICDHGSKEEQEDKNDGASLLPAGAISEVRTEALPNSAKAEIQRIRDEAEIVMEFLRDGPIDLRQLIRARESFYRVEIALLNYYELLAERVQEPR